MKKLPTFAIILIFIANFCAGFLITAKLTNHYLDSRNTQSVENNPDPYFWVMAFKDNEVQTILFEELEEFKKKNPKYSFLVPRNQENYYNEKLLSEYKKPSFYFEAEQIADNKQLIKLTSAGSLRDKTDIYEATEKEIIPKKSSEFSLIDAFILVSASFFGGTIACLISFIIYKKLIAY